MCVWLGLVLFPPGLCGAEPQTPKANADALSHEGIRHYRAGRADAARQSWEQALDLYLTTEGTEPDQAQCHKFLSVVFEDMGQIEAVLTHQTKALKLYQAIKGTERAQADCLQIIGEAQSRMGQYEAAIVRCDQALKALEAIQDTEEQRARCCLEIPGISWLQEGKHLSEA
jgi:tetratricopeptide (TPR) repeat protein